MINNKNNKLLNIKTRPHNPSDDIPRKYCIYCWKRRQINFMRELIMIVYSWKEKVWEIKKYCCEDCN